MARHGARLDAADKDWHLTSPTPYDPPLSYGGWIQSRALGLRIASLLHEPEFIGRRTEDPADNSNPLDDKTNHTPATADLHNKYNVIVHTSPFLRCLQTSIAVSAGISQYSAGTDPSLKKNAAGVDPRPLVRVDGFLGEWLSPEYFEHIIAPPNSDQMVALAKAELLRQGETILQAREGTRALSGHFPGGWGSQSQPTTPNEDDSLTPASNSQSTTPKYPIQRQRASTVDIPQPIAPATGTASALGQLDTKLAAVKNEPYVPPTPSYAVSASDPIPAGYVAHARDACIRVDYPWDSMRNPAWATGGEYGEEWSSMQERVAGAFDRMMQWYRHPEDQVSSPSIVAKDAPPREGHPKQTVLILVTHGADCSALINSLAGHPVMCEINTASVTLAVPRARLPSPDVKSDRSPTESPPGDQSISREYSLQLIASTDHLRAGVNPAQASSLTSPSTPQPPSPPSIPAYRNRLSSRPAPLSGTFSIAAISTTELSPQGWTFAHRPSISDVPRIPSGGLWSSLASPDEKDEDQEEDFVPNFGDRRPVSHDSKLPDVPVDRSGWGQKLPQRTRSQRGLWGSAASLENREAVSRRRWTLAEQKL